MPETPETSPPLPPLTPSTLYLVATPIGNLEDITLRALRTLKECDVVAAEDTRHTGQLLRHYSISKPLISYFRFNEARRSEEIIDRLFPDNPLLCCGKSQSEFDTKPREAWRGEMAQLQFIVPSPMSAVTGLTKEGKESKHALSNTGPRRFLVVECDFSIYARDGKTETKLAPLIRKLDADGFSVADMCAVILLHLPASMPSIDFSIGRPNDNLK
jgi:hypothetical protein